MGSLRQVSEHCSFAKRRGSLASAPGAVNATPTNVRPVYDPSRHERLELRYVSLLALGLVRIAAVVILFPRGLGALGRRRGGARASGPAG